jgi:hypothetical protein
MIDSHNIVVVCQNCLFEAMFSVYKASRDEGRELLLSWIAEAVEGNAARSRIQVDLAVVSSEGFILNLAAVLCLFCKPFLDPRSNKVEQAHRIIMAPSLYLTHNGNCRWVSSMQRTSRLANA